MRGEVSNSWWHQASTSQRLAQIDGGIECGMNAADIAVCSGLHRHHSAPIRSVAEYHGRTLPAEGGKRGASRQRRKGDLKRVYWQGGRDFSDAGISSFVEAPDDRAEVAFE